MGVAFSLLPKKIILRQGSKITYCIGIRTCFIPVLNIRAPKNQILFEKRNEKVWKRGVEHIRNDLQFGREELAS
jgi:hypothetical protein